MPWHVAKNSGCPASKPYAVVKETDGSIAGCHPTRGAAEKQMRALYAQEPQSAGSDDMTTTLGGKPNPGTKPDKRLAENPPCAPGMKMGPGGKCIEAAEGDPEYLAKAPPPPTDCPPGMKPGPDGKCMPMMEGETEPLADAPAEVAEPAGGAWSGVLVVEGTPTGDGREFAPDSLSWPDPAAVTMALQWQKESSHGGTSDVTVAVGRIDRIWREGPLIMGEGRFDTHDDAVEAERRMGAEMLNGVSIGADDITDANIEQIYPEGDGVPGDAEDDILSLLFARPEKVIFHSARLRAATLCDIPAYVEATLHTVAPGEGPAPAVTTSHSVDHAAVPTHESATSQGPWDAPAAEARLRAVLPIETARAAYAYVEGVPIQGQVARSQCRFLHHEIGEDGTPGAASISACLLGIQAVHAARISDAEKEGVYRHLAAHLAAAGEQAPPYEPQHALMAHAWQEEMWRPPAGWFRDPGILAPTPILVSDAGRVYGLASEWTECHLGYLNECQLPPRENYHSHFLTGEIECDDGSRVPVGQITAGIGHASLSAGTTANQAKDHYDNTEAVVADVNVGNCAAGIWVAGAIRPSAQAARVQALRASGQVSPDWRRVGGQLRMVGLLTVNISGFQVPRMRTLVAGGQVQALIASGMTSVHFGPSTDELDQRAMRLQMDRLAARVHG